MAVLEKRCSLTGKHLFLRSTPSHYTVTW